MELELECIAIEKDEGTSAILGAWNSLPEAERRAKERQGMAAWKAWVEKPPWVDHSVRPKRSLNAASKT